MLESCHVFVVDASFIVFLCVCVCVCVVIHRVLYTNVQLPAQPSFLELLLLLGTVWDSVCLLLSTLHGLFVAAEMVD